MPEFEITALDIAILVTYVIGTRILFGWYYSRKAKEGSEGYFLAGRNIAWPIIGLSFYVSNMSGSSFVGLPASGYATGISVYNYEWVPVAVLVFFLFFVLPQYLAAKIYTAPEFLEKRYDRRARYIFSGFLLLANIFIDAASALYAGATVAQTLFPEIPLWLTVAATALVAGVYIFFGGLGAVVINDALQALLIFAGGLAICILGYLQLDGWSQVQEHAPERGLHLMQPADDPTMPWPGLLGVLIIGLYFWCMNQFVIQRALGAKDMTHARYGLLFAGLLKLPNLFILILPGVIAAALYPDLENADMAFPAMAFDLLPIGFRGLMLAALAAAILSSLEAILNSASTLLTMDFVRTLRPQAQDRTLVWVGRGATIGFMLVAAVWAPQIQHFPTLWQYLQSILAYVTPPIVAVFLLGIFWRRASPAGANFTLGLGIPLGVLAWCANELWSLVELQYLYAGIIMFGVSLAIHLATSLLSTPRPEKDIAPLLWSRPEKIEPIARNWRASLDYRVLTAALLALTGGMVIWWW